MLASIESLLENVGSDMLGVIILLAVIMSFAALIAISVTLIEAVKSIMLARMSKGMIQDLLARGYSAEDVERLVHGKSKWAKVKDWMKLGRNEKAAAEARPMPPVKQPSV